MIQLLILSLLRLSTSLWVALRRSSRFWSHTNSVITIFYAKVYILINLQIFLDYGYFLQRCWYGALLVYGYLIANILHQLCRSHTADLNTSDDTISHSIPLRGKKHKQSNFIPFNGLVNTVDKVCGADVNDGAVIIWGNAVDSLSGRGAPLTWTTLYVTKTRVIVTLQDIQRKIQWGFHPINDEYLLR